MACLALAGLVLGAGPLPAALAGVHGGRAHAPAVGHVAPAEEWRWPTGAPAPVLEGFNPPSQVWGPGHRGVDLALAAGSPVLAAGAGTVAFAGSVAGRPVVSIDHDGGIRTTYEPVEAGVAAGEQVVAGQVIGVLVAGHRSDGVDALHWGARTGRKTYVNPLRLLERPVIRLKPLDASHEPGT
ncbi:MULTISPECIES: murein hydrolase activator EnvC [unclassified Actinomyces]|nr:MULTISPECIES: M23 family metallopeptidase [unclassified Actinomyces]MCL3778562.1 M23 family metallopeptidase [Actinomyces sp. AC-20-1]MCL3795437.1 M23 family metallopeptidase [Actinomyces sp. 217892]